MTQTVLHIDASARHQDSVSRKLSKDLVNRLNPDQVITRDLADGLPFLDEAFTVSTFTPPANRTEAQDAALAQSDELVSELQAADTVVIGTPIYNFHGPAVLKAWMDQVARAGVTFKYTENGPQGLLSGKKAIVTVASGGVNLGTPGDFLSPHLKFFLGFLGIDDVTFLDAETAPEFNLAA